MAIFWDAPVSPDALTAFVRSVPLDPTLALLEGFPAVNTPDNTIDFAEIVKRNRTAKFRTFDGSIHVSERDSGSAGKVKLLPLSTSLNESEYERLQRVFAQTGGTFTSAMEQAIYNDAENLTRYVQNRLELAWGDVLTDGILTINENGLVGFEADFGVPTSHKPTAGTPWTATATAPALTNMIAWWDTFRATNGNVPAAAFEWQSSQRVRRLAQTNKEIVDAVHGAAAGRSRVTISELNELMDDNDLPNFGQVYDGALDVDNTITPVIPDDKLILLPKNRRELGYTAWGVSATALELVESNVSDLSFEEAPGIVGVVEKVGPPYRKFTFVDATAMPVLENAKRLFIADVA